MLSAMQSRMPAEPASANSERLEARNVSIRFKVRGHKSLPFTRKSEVHAVEDVSLSIARGEMFGIAGESGCGKSTLARALVHLNPPTEGLVLLDGTPVASLPSLELRRRVQMVFQDPYNSLNPRRKVGDIIADSLTIHRRFARSERRAQAIAMLERVGLGAHHYERFPHEFSGGQRQRIAIARAIILKPEFLVLDEPTSALDVSVQALVVALIQELQQELKLGCVFISHDLNLLGFLTERIAVMYLGRIVEAGTTAEVFAEPFHPYTPALMAATPSPESDTAVRRVPLEGEIPSNVNPPTGCPFHTRCQARIGPVCDEKLPALAMHGGRMVRCHLYDPEVVKPPKPAEAAV
jgi:oligopeptide/dipeptide ABC transporter ATP-binding protein